MPQKFTKVTQGYATLASDKDIHNDIEVGITNPNLHRRIKTTREIRTDEVAQREYSLSVRGVNSYRTTESFTHDEDSVTREIP